MKEKKTAVEKWSAPCPPPKQSLLEKRTAPLLKQAQSLVKVTSEDHYIAAGVMIQNIDDAAKWIEAVGRPFVQGLDKMHKAGVAWLKKQTAPLGAEKARLLSLRMTWFAIEQKKRDEAAAKAAVALQKQQQKELEKIAKKEEKLGNAENAAVVREQAASVPLPFIDAGAPVKQEGFYVKKRWIYTIVDPAAVEREYCSPDDALIRPVVEALGLACKISGLHIEEEVKEHSRSVAS
jgi:hypothetical protein